MIVGTDEERQSLLREVLIANKWRFSLGDGDLVDARCAGKWYEARITSATSDAVKVSEKLSVSHLLHGNTKTTIVVSAF